MQTPILDNSLKNNNLITIPTHGKLQLVLPIHGKNGGKMKDMVQTWANYTEFLLKDAENPEKVLNEEIQTQLKHIDRAKEHLKGIKLYLEQKGMHLDSVASIDRF
jgi:hypothetical protein